MLQLTFLCVSRANKNCVCLTVVRKKTQTFAIKFFAVRKIALPNFFCVIALKKCDERQWREKESAVKSPREMIERKFLSANPRQVIKSLFYWGRFLRIFNLFKIADNKKFWQVSQLREKLISWSPSNSFIIKNISDLIWRRIIKILRVSHFLSHKQQMIFVYFYISIEMNI